jgi:hypothetical protein
MRTGLNRRALPILALLAACGADQVVSSDDWGYRIYASADLVETSPVPWNAILYSVLVEEGVGFESMACAESAVYEPTSHWGEQGNLAANCSGSQACPPLTIREGFFRTLSSPLRLQLYAVLGDESTSNTLSVSHKPPALPGDLYGVSTVFEVHPGSSIAVLPDPIVMDQVFQGCP